MPKTANVKKPRDKFSVLIAEKRTLSSLKKHLPFFQQALNEGKLGIIEWVPDQDSFEEAFPGLLDLIEDKRHWNAILIDLPLLARQQECLTKPCQANPFDLTEEWFEESEERYPLLRAAHMLAGFPAVDFKLEADQESKAGIRLSKDQEKEEAFLQLEEQYMFDGFKPQSIFFISARINFDARKARIQKSFQKEQSRKDFYTRNAYPENIRFLLYDFTNQGSLQRDAESMEFWLFVHSLSLNEELASYFKAYQLYSFKTNLDIDRLQEFLQEKADQLRASREYLIRESRNRKLAGKEPISLEQHIEIQRDLPEKPGFSIPNTWFFEPVPFLSHSLGQDLEVWKKDMDQVEKNFFRFESSLEEEKDQRIQLSKENARVYDGEAKALNKVQKAEIKEQQDKAQKQIYEMKNDLAKDLHSLNEQIAEKNREIQKLIQSGRITNSGALELCLFVLTASLICFVPAFFFVKKEILPVGFTWSSLLFYEMLGVFTIVLVYVLVQRVRLKLAVNGMNELIHSKEQAILRYNDHLGDYLSSLATYTKCTSYLRNAEKREEEANDFSLVNQNINRIDRFLADLIHWAKASHLPLDLSQDEPVLHYMNNQLLMNKVSSYTAFENDNTGKSEINESGIMVESGYPFIEGLEIEQEDLHA